MQKILNIVTFNTTTRAEKFQESFEKFVQLYLNKSTFFVAMIKYRIKRFSF